MHTRRPIGLLLGLPEVAVSPPGSASWMLLGSERRAESDRRSDGATMVRA